MELILDIRCLICCTGLEFKNKEFNSLLKKYNMKLYHTENEEKSSTIERYNRTQNDYMKVIFEIDKNYRWITTLEQIDQIETRDCNCWIPHPAIQLDPALRIRK